MDHLSSPGSSSGEPRRRVPFAPPLSASSLDHVPITVLGSSPTHVSARSAHSSSSASDCLPTHVGCPTPSATGRFIGAMRLKNCLLLLLFGCALFALTGFGGFVSNSDIIKLEASKKLDASRAAIEQLKSQLFGTGGSTPPPITPTPPKILPSKPLTDTPATSLPGGVVATLPSHLYPSLGLWLSGVDLPPLSSSTVWPDHRMILDADYASALPGLLFKKDPVVQTSEATVSAVTAQRKGVGNDARAHYLPASTFVSSSPHRFSYDDDKGYKQMTVIVSVSASNVDSWDPPALTFVHASAEDPPPTQAVKNTKSKSSSSSSSGSKEYKEADPTGVFLRSGCPTPPPGGWAANAAALSCTGLSFPRSVFPLLPSFPPRRATRAVPPAAKRSFPRSCSARRRTV